MTVLNLADALQVGASAVDKVYLGADEVWSLTSAPTEQPVTFRGVTSVSMNEDLTVVFAAPAETEVGDRLLCFVVGGSEAFLADTPPGWTLLRGPTVGGYFGTTTYDQRGYMFTRVADGTANDDASVTRTGGSRQGGVVMAYTPCDIDNEGERSYSAGSASVAAPALLCRGSDQLLVSWHSLYASSGNHKVFESTPETPWTLRSSYATGTAAWVCGDEPLSLIGTVEERIAVGNRADAAVGYGVILTPHSTPAGTSSAATLTIAAQPSTLTDFVTRVDLADMPTAWWADVAANGGNIRVKQGGTVVPHDVIYVDRVAQRGTLYFKATLGTSSNVFTIDKSGDGRLAVTDPNGRNAVWSAYDVMIDGWQPRVNRTGGADITQTSVLPLIGPIALGPATGCHQGVAVDEAGFFYTIDDDEIVKWDSSWTEVARSTTPIADSGIAGVNHLGTGNVVDGELYIVLEYFTSSNTVWNNQHIAVYNLSDLSFNRSYNISAQAHEVSGIDYNPEDGYFYVTDWTAAGDSVLHKYDLDPGASSYTYLGTVALSSSVAKKQGIAYHQGYWWMTGDPASASKAIWRADLDGTGVTEAAGAYLGDATGDNLEGLCSDGTHLYVMFDQGATDRRVYTYEMAGQSERIHFDVRGYLRVVGFPLRTSWTMGATSVLAKKATSNRALLSHSDNSDVNNNRATLAASSSRAKYATWNSTNAWLDDPGSTPARLDNMRFHLTYNEAVARAIWRNGVMAASGATATRPVTGGTLFMGVEDTTGNEGLFGALARIYLRAGVMSADWLAAEYASWETPSAFYSVS